MYSQFNVFGHKVTIEQERANQAIHSECLVIDMQEIGNIWIDPLSEPPLESQERGTYIDIMV